MKKIVFILVMLIFVTGCNSSYNLKIVNDNFEENILLNIDNKDINSNNQITSFLNEKTTSVITEDSFYDKKINNFQDYTEVILKEKYNENQFQSSKTLNLCFENKTVLFEDTYYINLYGSFYCLYGNSMDIKIQTKNKVYVNNADEVDGNTYIWHIDSSNQDDVNILIELDKGFTKREKIILAGVIILVIVLIGIVIFIKKHKAKDSFK